MQCIDIGHAVLVAYRNDEQKDTNCEVVAINFHRMDKNEFHFNRRSTRNDIAHSDQTLSEITFSVIRKSEVNYFSLRHKIHSLKSCVLIS